MAWRTGLPLMKPPARAIRLRPALAGPDNSVSLPKRIGTGTTPPRSSRNPRIFGSDNTEPQLQG